MRINIFTPPKFHKSPLDIEYLNRLTQKEWHYTTSGKASIYHILKDLELDTILVPIYICDTILEPLKRLNIVPIFYDIETMDLNNSLKSIKKQFEIYNSKAILVASMYGNPANLVEIEKYCHDNEIFMIDDSAQSFGAKLENRYVGTFGDAGFFSFSTGKPTAGHMGSFFWSKNNINIKRKRHCFIHYFRWLDFYYNRYRIYDNIPFILKRTINLFSRFQLKLTDISNDDICNFEKEIIGGILLDNINGNFDFRENYIKSFISKFKKSSYFRIIEPIRGIANRHKFILLFNSKDIAKNFIKYMQEFSIYASNGYTLLSKDLEALPNAKEINKKVVELPVEDDKEKMKYLFEKVEKFEYKNIKR